MEGWSAFGIMNNFWVKILFLLNFLTILKFQKFYFQLCSKEWIVFNKNNVENEKEHTWMWKKIQLSIVIVSLEIFL